MPCNGCGKQTASDFPRVFNVNLDRAELALSAAWITDANPERRILIDRVKRLVQDLKTPTPIPLETQLDALRHVSDQVGSLIQCRYCRMVYYYDVVKSVAFHAELERGHYWHALKIYVEKEVKKVYWLLARLIRFRRTPPKT